MRYLIAGLICWNLTALVVLDDVFEGTRDSVFGVLGRILGPSRPSQKWGLRPLERWFRNVSMAQRLGRRSASSGLTERVEALLADARAQNAVVSTAWYRVVRRVAPKAFATLFIHHLPVWAGLKVVGLARLLVEKISVGLGCPFCVAVWLAWPAWWITGASRLPDWVVPVLVVSAIARLTFHASTLSTQARSAVKAYQQRQP